MINSSCLVTNHEEFPIIKVSDETNVQSDKIVENFISIMENRQGCSSLIFSETAVLDWFGRSVVGRLSILNFVKLRIPKMHHQIDSIKRIPPISHRLLSVSKSSSISLHATHKDFVVECGQGDCKSKLTPEKIIQPNITELVKAPRKKQPLEDAPNFKEWQFAEIIGNLKLENIMDDGNIYVTDKRVKRIVLGYTDQIHFAAYEARLQCRKKLLPLFDITDE